MVSNINIEDEKFTIKGPLKVFSHASVEIDIKAILNSVTENGDHIKPREEIRPISNDTLFPSALALIFFNHTVDGIPATSIKGYDYFIVMPSENTDAASTWKPLAGAGPGRSVTPGKKTRLLVKKGVEVVPLLLEDVGLIYTQNKLVFVIDRFSKKYISDKTLSELEEELDSAAFFRANRQYILNISYIKSFKPYDTVKLLVDITIADMSHSIVISQETAPAFRKWMQDA